MRVIAALTSLVVVFLTACASDTPTELDPSGGVTTFETEKVVLVIIDGLRYSEGLGHPSRAHTPRMGALADRGVLIADAIRTHREAISRHSRTAPGTRFRGER